MNQMLDPLAQEPLARRLAGMAVAVPAAPALAADGARHGTRPRPRWRMGAALVAGLAIALVSVTAAAYPGGLGALTDDVLQAAGLRSQGEVTGVSGSAQIAGVKVEVDGGYADQVATVLFVSVTPPCQGASCQAGVMDAPYLIDQYGTRYTITGGAGIGVGAYPMFFGPLRGQAAAAGARLTLHVPVYTAPMGQRPAEVVVPVAGVLRPADARRIDPPAPVVDAQRGVTYSLSDLIASGAYLEVHTRLTGNLESVITRYGGAAMTGEVWPGVFLIGPDGRWQIDLAGGGAPPTVNQQVQDETRVFSARSGVYRIVVAASADASSTPGPGWTVLASWTVRVP